jgi:hypothetical protein
MPLVASAFQSLATSVGLDQPGDVGFDRELTMSAGLPSTTPRDWSPDAP